MQNRTKPIANYYKLQTHILKFKQMSSSYPSKIKLPQLPALEHLKNKSDLIPEVFFCGQIVGGIDFESEDALLC